MALAPSSTSSELYLGRNLTTDTPFYLPARHLTTHGVCIGMTGSGKTGLCIGLLEEAALAGIPVIAIDPKGDLTNLALTFPELRPGDFAPYLSPQEAARHELSPEAYAERKAATWRQGLADWGIGPDRIQQLRERTEVTLYTPGSSAGQALSVLQSFTAPEGHFEDREEELRDEIAGAVEALLGMLRIDADPIRSREHILLCQIIEHEWRAGKSVSLLELVTLIHHPPVTRFGALSLDAFFPADERQKLGMLINNLLAAPSFEDWITGMPMEIDALLQTASGKPRISVMTLSHLSDAERLFFITLLLNQWIGWMRRQPGTNALRALLYFDEVFGYLPPHPRNPPSKRLILTLLKQARAFGLGTMLVTQNPVDLDYKALSNCGTWFIGRLQTDQDRQRILDGLSGAAGEQGATLSKSELARQIAALETRQFLVHSARENRSGLIESRWAISFLAGPLTRTQIRELRENRSTSNASTPISEPPASSPAPLIPPNWNRYFRQPIPEAPLQAYLYLEVTCTYTQRRWNEDYPINQHLLLPLTQPDWRNAQKAEPDNIATEPPAEPVEYAPGPALLQDPKALTALIREVDDHLAQNAGLTLHEHDRFKLTSRPGHSREEFQAEVATIARKESETERDQAIEKIDSKLATLRDRLERETLQWQNAREALEERRKKQWLGVAGDLGHSLLGMLGGRRRSQRRTTRALTDALTGSNLQSAEARVAEQALDVRQVREEIAALEAEKTQIGATVDPAIARAIEEIEKVTITPAKSRVRVLREGILFG